MTNDVAKREPILFVRGGALGDFVLTLPVLAALFATGRRVDVVCAPKHLPLVRLCGEPGFVYDILGVDSVWTFGGVSPVPYAEAVCFSEARASQLAVPLVHWVAAKPPEDVPAWQHFSSVWRQFSSATTCEPGIVLGARAAGSGPLEPDAPPPIARGLIVVAPGASSAAKTWPLEQWFRLAEGLRAAGHSVEIVGGPLEPWAEHRPELPELIQLLSRASTFIGPDSGPAHLAARLGARTFVVCTERTSMQWVPYGASALSGETSIERILFDVQATDHLGAGQGAVGNARD